MRYPKLETNLETGSEAEEALSPEAVLNPEARSLLEILDSFDRRLEESVQIGSGWELPCRPGEVSNVLFCGMGGSAIGGELLAAYLQDELTVPICVNRESAVPGWVSDRTLVVVCSYSGNTQETLQALRLARRRGARLCGLTSGGELAEIAAGQPFPLASMPKDLPPRVAVGCSMIPTLVLLQRLGLCDHQVDQAAGSMDFVRGCCRILGPGTAPADNPAKQLAAMLRGRVPVTLGGGRLTGAMARRWAGQFSENAKQVAFFDALPEVAHNQVVGWLDPGFKTDACLTAVWLSDREDSAPSACQREWIVTRMDALGMSWILARSHGPSRLDRLWSLLLLGDYASVYLAVLYGRDPLTVEPIEELKSHLAGSRSPMS